MRKLEIKGIDEELPSRRLPASHPPSLLLLLLPAAGLSLATAPNFISTSTSLDCCPALLCSYVAQIKFITRGLF